MIPTGRELDVGGTDRDFTAGREIGALVLDTAYTRLDAGPDGLVRAVLSAPEGGRLSVWMGPGTTHVMVYTGDAIGRAGLAIEPMTCPPNAFQSGDGVRVLLPGERWTFAWGVEPAS
jgi:aldose 1-epimerase